MTAVSQLLEHQDRRRIATTEIQPARIVEALGQNYLVTTADCPTPFEVTGDARFTHAPGEAVSIARDTGSTGAQAARPSIVTHPRAPTGVGGVLARASQESTAFEDDDPEVYWGDPRDLFPSTIQELVILGGINYLNLPGDLATVFTAMKRDANGEFVEHPEVTISDVLGTIDVRAQSAVTCTVTTTAAVIKGERLAVRAERVEV